MIHPQSYFILFCSTAIHKLMQHDLFRAVLDAVHAAHPYHLVLCFKLFRDTLGLGHLRNQDIECPDEKVWEYVRRLLPGLSWFSQIRYEHSYQKGKGPLAGALPFFRDRI